MDDSNTRAAIRREVEKVAQALAQSLPDGWTVVRAQPETTVPPWILPVSGSSYMANQLNMYVEKESPDGDILMTVGIVWKREDGKMTYPELRGYK
jgi:hypothetical protein